MSEQKIRVILADDHAIVLEGLRALLESEPDMEVAASTVDGHEVVALVGDSGAGKSTLARGCADILGTDRVTQISLDDYHALDRAARTATGLTALHPDSSHLALMGQHARLLRNGETIFKPVYDHADGTFGRPQFVRPGAIVLVNGLHGLFTPELRSLWDVSVFLDPAPELRAAWKIKRDTATRTPRVRP